MRARLLLLLLLAACDCGDAALPTWTEPDAPPDAATEMHESELVRALEDAGRVFTLIASG